jgi:hypothetical protein
MKIRIDVTELNLEGTYGIVDLSDPYDKERFAPFFDLYGNLLPDADHCDLLAALLEDRIERFVGAGWVETQDRYIEDCAVVPQPEAA